jgi:putative hemolysin
MATVALLLSLLVVAWLSAGSMAVRSASRIWLRHWAERRLRGAESVMIYLERPVRLLAAANAGAAIALGLVGIWIGRRSAINEATAMMTLGGYAALVVLLAHLLPRAIGRRWPSAVIPITMPVMRFVQLVTAPMLALGRLLGGVADEAQEPQHEAMDDLLREGELEGVGKTDEIAIISGVMEFGEKTVKDVMTPRTDVFAIGDDVDPIRVPAMIAESAFSRIPVYSGSLDNIVGMYHAFDVLKEGHASVLPVRPVAYAPAATRCNDLLFRMLKARLHLAVVQDEQKRTLGVATLENLLEELVGDIRDEHDEPSGMPAPRGGAR